jgi:DNA repair exonuclease SbcCD nuclease subunit
MLTGFIHTGDLHLGRPFTFNKYGNVYGKNKRKELWSAFDEMVHYADEFKVPLILIAGDLFDSQTVITMDVKRVAEAFERLKETRIVIITGNHDYYGENSPYKKVIWPKNVYIFKDDTFKSIYIQDLNVEIYGMSWVKNQYRDFPEIEFKGLQLEETHYNILMLHGEVGGLGPYLPLDLKLLESKGFNTIALGHIHKPGMASGGVAYCGSPVPLHFGETGDHGFLVSRIKTDYENQAFYTSNGLDKIESRSYYTKEIDIIPENTYHDIIEKILCCDVLDKRRENFYRIILKGYIEPEIQLEWLEDDLEDEFYYVEVNTSKIEPDIDIARLLLENGNNVIGKFIRELQAIENTEVRSKALQYSIEAMVGEGIIK